MAADPFWINAADGAPAYSAAALRRAWGALLVSAVADRFGARAGVHPAGLPAVSLSGTTITVRDLRAVVYPGLTSLSGPYLVALPEETHELDPADATNPRKDIVVLHVYDNDEDGSGQRTALTEYIAGVPAASPSAPATPTGTLRLATISVPASGGGSPSLAYDAPYYVALGGILPVRNDAELPGSTSGLYHGMVRFNQGTGTLDVHDGSTTWSPFASASAYDLLMNPPACRVYHDASQLITDNTETTVNFNSERFDTDSMHSTSVNTSRITFTTAGMYMVGFHGLFQAGADYVRAFASLRKNGATEVGRGPNPGSAAGPQVAASTMYKFAAADYLEARVFQDNTANAARNLLSSAEYSPEFWAVRLGSGT